MKRNANETMKMFFPLSKIAVHLAPISFISTQTPLIALLSSLLGFVDEHRLTMLNAARPSDANESSALKQNG
ncbi:hypothetical protein T12_13442 [Trichinella patagoniensis]|uniref:Uncharacterized protein n=1 Tax=Trichinella patagoniensis TaxID=990121 RepID=A0A0V1A8J6_9BILA|nr:hypothetical protein T12_13442 [Trichinella patagoniensis]